MLSAFRSGALRSVIQGHGAFRELSVVPSRTYLDIPKRVYTKEEYMNQWDYVNSVYYGPERDMKNFPNPTQPATPPPLRMGIFPASWFDFFYPKTGATGPFVFSGGLILYMMSKEILVIDHYFWEIPSFWGAMWFINHKFGAGIRNYFDQRLKVREEMYYTRPIRKWRESELKNIAAGERKIEECETAKHVYQAQQEGVGLQLEAAYRQRLLTAFQEVKKRLDYEVEKENVKRKFEQDHMVNWIVSSVTKSITPQQEKDSIQNCIATLKNLAAKQA